MTDEQRWVILRLTEAYQGLRTALDASGCVLVDAGTRRFRITPSGVFAR